MADRRLYHYTDRGGYNAIRSQPIWRFKASKPAGDHPLGAYFTTYPPETRRLARRLMIPADKLEFVFCFVDRDDLFPLPGDRGEFILYSARDYEVTPDRQIFSGPTDELAGAG